MKDAPSVLILAAGSGTRMRSLTPKVLHPLADVPLIEHIIQTVRQLNPNSIGLVVGHGKEKIVEKLGTHKNLEFITQKEQLGSGNAVQSSVSWIKKCGKRSPKLLVLCGDAPLITTETLQSLLTSHAQEKNAATILSSIVSNPTGYGRIVRNSNEHVKKIVEEKDSTLEEKKIREVNSGVYCFDVDKLLESLPQLKNQNAKGEFYLTDIIEFLHDRGYVVEALQSDPEKKDETLGINTRADLAFAEMILQQKIIRKWMEAGVTFINPLTSFVGKDVKIGKESEILPGTMLMGKTEIGEGSKIGPHSYIKDSVVGNNTRIRASFIYGAKIGNNCKIGPFTHLRAGTVISQGARIGNFTEIKNSSIGVGSKVSHLAYIGDATLEEDINVGAGAITCNFDGKKKHRTYIGAKSFVGSNVNLIAPVRIGARALLAAGSTITKDVPDDALAIERSTQTIKEGWTKKKK